MEPSKNRYINYNIKNTPNKIFWKRISGMFYQIEGYFKAMLIYFRQCLYIFDNSYLFQAMLVYFMQCLFIL